MPRRDLARPGSPPAPPLCRGSVEGIGESAAASPPATIPIRQRRWPAPCPRAAPRRRRGRNGPRRAPRHLLRRPGWPRRSVGRRSAGLPSYPARTAASHRRLLPVARILERRVGAVQGGQGAAGVVASSAASASASAASTSPVACRRATNGSAASAAAENPAEMPGKSGGRPTREGFVPGRDGAHRADDAGSGGGERCLIGRVVDGLSGLEQVSAWRLVPVDHQRRSTPSRVEGSLRLISASSRVASRPCWCRIVARSAATRQVGAARRSGREHAPRSASAEYAQTSTAWPGGRNL